MKPNSLKALGTAAFLTISAGIGAPITLEKEGMVLKPYFDSVGVKTWCAGETEIGYKEAFTKSECSALFLMRYGFYSKMTRWFYSQKAEEIVTPPIHVAMTDMSYNLGLPRIKTSGMIKLLNKGKAREACNRILAYKFAGGHDCSADGNKVCPGVWKRRQDMHKLCLSGVSQ